MGWFKRSNSSEVDHTEGEVANVNSVETKATHDDEISSEASQNGMEVDLATYEKAAKTSRPIDQTNSNNNKNLFIAIGVIFLSIIIAIIVALSVALPKKMNANADNIPSPSPTTNLQGQIFDILSEYTPDDILNDPTTPQGQAFLQIVEESNEPIDEFRIKQRYALMTLYQSTRGWTTKDGWKQITEEHCEWYGITCNDNKTVTHLMLDDNTMKGVIPEEICMLSNNVERIDMGNNFLTGTIPQCINEFKNLWLLDLDDNKLTGELPKGLLTLPSLEVVELYSNELSGTLDVLFEDPNDTSSSSSSLPTTIEDDGPSLSKYLAVFEVYSNRISGTVPSNFESMLALKEFRVENNDLTGTISEGICYLGTYFLEKLVVDCDEVSCECCANCLWDN